MAGKYMEKCYFPFPWKNIFPHSQTRPKMKLNENYLPAEYKQTLYERFRSIADYYEEFIELTIKNCVCESDTHKAGLRAYILLKMQKSGVWSFEGAF